MQGITKDKLVSFGKDVNLLKQNEVIRSINFARSELENLLLYNAITFQKKNKKKIEKFNKNFTKNIQKEKNKKKAEKKLKNSRNLSGEFSPPQLQKKPFLLKNPIITLLNRKSEELQLSPRCNQLKIINQFHFKDILEKIKKDHVLKVSFEKLLHNEKFTFFWFLWLDLTDLIDLSFSLEENNFLQKFKEFTKKFFSSTNNLVKKIKKKKKKKKI